MNVTRLLAVVLLALGVLALVYRGFTYTKDTHDTKLGPIELSIKKKDHVTVPIWVGVVLVAAGGGLLLVPGRR